MKKLIVLTGASDGIGAAAARILSQRGHRLVLVGRTPEKIKRVAEQTKAERYFAVNYEKLDEVRALSDDLLKRYSHIDVLANNAGGLFSGPTKTQDGFEKTFQINHLAAFLLTHKLLDVLIKSKAAVVNTSSIAAKLFGHIDIDDLNSWNGFKANKAYGDGKLANILHVKGLHNRYHVEGLSAVAFHPGVIASNFAHDTNSILNRVYHSFPKLFLSSPEKGGDNLAYFIEGISGKDWISGNYYRSKRKIGKTNSQADDENLVAEHWKRSVEMLGI